MLSKINESYVLQKAYTILIDRRLWLSLFSLFIVFSGTVEDVNASEQLADQAVNWIVLGATVIQNILWTLRAPSGKKFSEDLRENSDLAEDLVRLLNG